LVPSPLIWPLSWIACIKNPIVGQPASFKSSRCLYARQGGAPAGHMESRPLRGSTHPLPRACTGRSSTGYRSSSWS
jgi:hypothetical protein